MRIFDYKQKKKLLITPCPFNTGSLGSLIVPTKIGSAACQQCRFFILINEEQKNIHCGNDDGQIIFNRL